MDIRNCRSCGKLMQYIGTVDSLREAFVFKGFTDRSSL